MAVDPVVVPIKADVSELATARAALQGLREDSQRVSPPGGGGAPAGGGGARDATSLSTAAVVRELKAMETGLQGVTTSLRALQSVVDAIVARGGRQEAMPLVAPPGGGDGSGGSTPAVTASVPVPPASPRTRFPVSYDAGRMLQSLFVGAAGTMGLSLGVGAAFGELSKGAATTEEMALQAVLATIAGGGGPGEYRAIREGALRSSFDTTVMPSDALSIMRPMAAHGMRGEGMADLAYLMGEAGMRGFGSAQAGGQLMDQAYASLRTPDVARYLATLVAQGERQGASGAELIRQFQGLAHMLGSRQGAYERTPQDLVELANLQLMLARVPGGAGRGEGGETIAQGLSEFGRGGPIENAVATKAYMRATGSGPPVTPEQRIAMEEWLQSPASWRWKAQVAREEFGPTVGGFLLSGKGRHSIRTFRNLMETPGELTDDTIGRLFENNEAGGFYGARNRNLDGTVGMDELGVRRDLERTRGDQETIARGHQTGRGIVADYYWPTVGAELLGGTLLGAGGLRMAQRLMRRMYGPAAVSAAGAAAGGSAAPAVTAANGVLPFLLRSMGIAGGGFSLAKDLYDVGTGDDPTNTLDLIFGASGAMIGGLAGIPGGFAGIALGGLTGYGLGKGVGRGLDMANQWFSGEHHAGAGFNADLARSLQFTHLPGGRVDLHSEGFRTAEQHYGLPPGILSALAEQESSGRLHARPYGKSAGGAQQYDAEGRPLQSSAYGLFQYINETGRNVGLLGDGFDMRGDPGASTAAAARDLRKAYDRWGSWDLALGSHYGGIGDPSASYGREVMRRVAKYSGAMGDDGGQVAAPEVTTPVGAVAGGESDGLHIFVHLDPDFPGTVNVQAPPGVVVRQVQ